MKKFFCDTCGTETDSATTFKVLEVPLAGGAHLEIAILNEAEDFRMCLKCALKITTRAFTDKIYTTKEVEVA